MNRRKKITIWVASSAVAAAVCVAGLVVLYDLPQISLNLEDLKAGGDDTPALVGYADHTDTVCKGIPGCVQGYSSDHAEFRKFDFPWNARAFADSHPDTYQSNFVVIQYTDQHLSTQDRKDVQSIFDNIGNSNDGPLERSSAPSPT